MDGSHNIGGMPPIDYTGLQWLGHIISEGCHRPGYSGNNIVWSIWHNKFYTAFSDSMFRRAGFKIVCLQCPGAYSGLAYNATAYGGPSMVDIGPGQYLLRAFIWDPSHFPIYEDPHISACC